VAEREPVALGWSGGKDGALALARLRDDPALEVVELITTVTSGYERVSIHGVRRALLHAQAAALGVPVREIPIAPGSSNTDYERAMGAGFAALRAERPVVRRIAWGDLFLADVRAYRERLCAASGFGCLFPLWGIPTADAAREVLARGIVARLVCVDTHALPAAFAGRAFDAALLGELPPPVDPCGENGEFHTFVSDGPGFSAPVPYSVPGDVVLREDRFAFAELLPAGA
jgi:uncharacterized protein (TIGR00290 family)